ASLQSPGCGARVIPCHPRHDSRSTNSGVSLMASSVRALLSRLWTSRGTPGVARKNRGRPTGGIYPFRPALECLEDRRVPANTGFLGGHVFVDPTGNGLLPTLSTPEGGVTVRLYK